MPNTPVRAAAEGMPKVQTTADQQAEHPAMKVRRLAKELSLALNEDADGRTTVAMIYPDGAKDYPIMFCYDDEFALISRRMFDYRDAHREKVRLYHETFRPGESVPLPQLPQHKAYWDAFHRASRAHMALMDAFDLHQEGCAE